VWTGVLEKCLAFLQTSPSEFIIIKVQQEYRSEGNTNSTWGSLLMKAVAAVPPENIWIDSQIPTVRQARGRIVLTTWSPILRPSYEPLGLIPWGGVCKEDEAYYIQDDFDSPTISKKWQVFVLLWIRSLSDKRSPPDFFFVNHASATDPKILSGPMRYATSMHKRLYPFMLFMPVAPQIFF